MTVLSDSEILDARSDGSIVIEPFDENNLGNCSYDVCLGEWYYRERQYAPTDIFNIYDENHVNTIWGKAIGAIELQAIEAEELQKSYAASLKNINPPDRVILIQPGETILAHTNEFIGARYNITTMMKARSSFGRCFIEVCKCSGWGDIGYINRWTMEITNNSRFYTIPLVVGRRIAQIVFINTGDTMQDYDQKGKYQDTNSIEYLQLRWKPEEMLPKLYLDRELG